MFKLRLRIGLVLLLLMFGLVSSSAITSSISAGHKQSITINESDAPSADSPSLTWTARTQSVPTPLENGSNAVGDHVVLNATFPAEMNVTQSEMRILNGFRYTTTRPLVIATDPGSVYEADPVDPSQFDWVTIPGMVAGLSVNITCNFTNGDCDFMAWPDSILPSERTYANNIVNMASVDKPEHDSIIWPEDGAMYLACLNYNGSIGNWTLHLQVGEIVLAVNNSSTVSMDTYYLAAYNQTYNVEVTGYTDTNTTYVLSREDILICNFFIPEVTVPSPEPLVTDERTYNITWSCTDRNADEVTYYSIWLSNDDGVSYMLLVQNFTGNWYIWDSNDWLDVSYMIRVRANSIDLTMSDLSDPPAGYWPGDFGEGFSPQFPPRNGPPPVIRQDVTVNQPSDISYTLGAIGDQIIWMFSFSGPGSAPNSVSYKIYRNTELLVDDYINFFYDGTEVFVDVHGLEPGGYNYTIHLENPGESGGIVIDAVYVTVLDPTISIMLQTFFVICIPGIVLVVLVSFFKKRNYRIG